MKRTTAFFIFLVITCSSFGQHTYDVFTYTEPKGYKKEIKPGLISYSKTDATSGTYCIVSLYGQTSSKGDIQIDFARDWQQLVVTPFKATTTPESARGDSITGWETYSGAASFEFGGGTSMVLLTTAKKENTNASVLIVTNTQLFLAEVDSFLGDLKLGSPAATIQPVTMPEIKQSGFTGNGIEGVWLMYNKPGILMKLSWNWRVFFNDGKSLQNIPSKGLYNYDITNEKNLSIGRYSFAKGKGTNFKYIEQRKPDIIVLKKPDQIEIDGILYVKCISVTGGGLSGSFTSYANPKDPQLQTLPDGEKPVITFTKEGRFKDEGIFNTYLFDRTTNPAAAKPGNGSYELKDFSILLNYDDGRRRQEAFTLPFGYTTTTALIILLGRSQLNKMP